MLFRSSKNSPKPVLYFTYFDWLSTQEDSLEYVKVHCTPDTDEGYAFDIGLEHHLGNTTNSGTWARPKYNSTFTFLRLGIDGNIRFFTYYDKVDWGAWEVTYILFDRNWSESECQLPERCGEFGLCDNNQCVACPMSNGLLGWSKDCKPKKITSCGMNDFHYYKVEGADHFMSKFTTGNTLTENNCGKKCSEDCKCLGYFYHKETSKCWVAYDLNTLTKSSNSTHVGYIKVPNH